jgi:biopolymer transport protein ExbD
MAEMETSGGGGGKHKDGVRSKKMSTRVDLTPMVDLAFLLITFFMLTTTLNKPHAMQLNMPKKADTEEEKQEVLDCQVMSVLIDTLDQVWYYEGLKVAGLQKTTFATKPGDSTTTEKNIETVIRAMIKKVPRDCPPTVKGPREAIVLIKMLKGARYQNMVDILNEMDITKCKTYAIQEPDPIEAEAVANGGVVKEFTREVVKADEK